MKRFILVTFISALMATSTYAKVLRNYVSESDNMLTFKVDSIDYRSDLTRVYGKLTGRPHTSNRIDGVTAIASDASFTATDIDGVDFRRYFQWEEDGTILIELDFPTMNNPQTIQLLFATPLGQSQTIVKVQPKQHK